MNVKEKSVLCKILPLWPVCPVTWIEWNAVKGRIKGKSTHLEQILGHIFSDFYTDWKKRPERNIHLIKRTIDRWSQKMVYKHLLLVMCTVGMVPSQQFLRLQSLWAWYHKWKQNALGEYRNKEKIINERWWKGSNLDGHQEQLCNSTTRYMVKGMGPLI